MELVKSKKLEKIIEEFREYLQTDEARSHLDYLKIKEPKETKEVFEQLKKMNRNSEEFIELVLYGLLPYAKTKKAKRVSIAPAFMDIKKFFQMNYSDLDWKNVANLIFEMVSEFYENPKNLEKAITRFASSKYSKRFQCGAITPIFYALNNNFPIVNAREIRTYERLSEGVLGKSDQLNRKLIEYPANCKKLKEFTRVLSEEYGFKEINDTAILDLFCYWFDESIKESSRRKRGSKYKDEMTDEERQKVIELIKEGKTLSEIKKITFIRKRTLRPIYRELKSEGLISKKKEKEDIFEETEEEQPLVIPPEAKKVIWQPKDYSIRELFEMYKDGELYLRPAFQRLFVWDPVKSSRLVESIFLDIPIPVIYLAEEENGSFTVIDGQQRLKSFFDFMDGELSLRKLLVLSELNGKKFTELDNEHKSKLKKATLHTIVIKKESQEDIRFEIFERLNTGAVKLNDQELRNCMFRGGYNEFLKELAGDKDFLFLLGLREPHKRMMDRELVLRFFAFYHSTYLRYEQPMKSFLNSEMRNYAFLDEKEMEKLRKLFKKSIDLTKTVFGENSFRRFRVGNEIDYSGTWERKKINKALFDVVMYGFTEYEKHQIVPRSDAIREELLWLMTHDQGFIDSIMFGTSDKSKVLIRFEKWLKNLREIVGYPEKEPRGFSLDLKRDLYQNNPTCNICGQKIQTLDDAEVDHIEFYWRGGKTIPSNARLVHRYCNRHRGGRD